MHQAFIRVATEYQPLLRQIGLDAHTIFDHPEICVWRSLADRENATLDAALSENHVVRLHIKRYAPVRGHTTPAELEARGIQLLIDHRIPTVPLVACGRLHDSRSFIILEDLKGYRAADRLIEEERFDFDLMRDPSADLTARLHGARLHHRDLYLNHFFVKQDSNPVALRLIDAARVRPLPRFFSRRWILKDLAQFWYSADQLGVSVPQRRAWLQRYAARRGLRSITRMLHAIRFKARWIARHDARLNRRQPHRNAPLPGA